MTMNEKIEITAFIKSAPGHSEALKKAIVELIEETVKEPGCIEFQVFQNNKDPEEFILWEIFRSQEDMQEHMAKDYTKKYLSSGLTLSTKTIRQANLI